jgi:hypothetical protein
MLTCSDAKIITVSLEALQNLLRVGKKDAERSHQQHGGGARNYVAVQVEECGGLDKIEQLQEHESEDVYQRSQDLLRDFFAAAESADDGNLGVQAPAAQANGFSFNVQPMAPAVAAGGFAFSF